jgi:hypothetical protein
VHIENVLVVPASAQSARTALLNVNTPVPRMAEASLDSYGERAVGSLHVILGSISVFHAGAAASKEKDSLARHGVIRVRSPRARTVAR